MTTSIHDTWGEFRGAFDQVLALAHRNLCLFDGNLEQLGLSQTNRIEQLRRLATENPAAKIRIALKATDQLHRNHPRLIQLLETHSHAVHVQQIPDSLQHLRDTLVIADASHALIRFDQDHPRSKLILADQAATAPYAQRFEAIWSEGGYAFSPNTLGL